MTNPGSEADGPDAGDPPLTTLHLRRAVAGDQDSLGWLVARLTPLLLAQAEYRLGPALRREVDPADLVDDAWLAALPKLAQLSTRDGRLTPVLLKFLSTTMTFRVNRLLRRRLGRPDPGDDVAGEPAAASGVVTRVVRGETDELVRRHIASLAAADREVLVLRGIEQLPARTVAVMLDIAPAAVDQRYSRALKRLRAALPRSVFAELDGEDS